MLEKRLGGETSDAEPDDFVWHQASGRGIEINIDLPDQPHVTTVNKKNTFTFRVNLQTNPFNSVLS